MNILHKIYKILFSYFKKDLHITDNANKDEYIGYLSFYITKNKDIDIICGSPDITHKSLDEMNALSEIYAEFLLYLNSGYLKDDILNILNNKFKNKELTEDQQAKYKLFFDNVIFNWAILYSEHLKKKKQNRKDDQPLVRPSAVFNP